MTEAKESGKLPFWGVLGLAILMTASHFRMDCTFCVSWFGTGQFRKWWLTFWASMLPLWTVMLIKTTHDQELSQYVGDQIGGMRTWLLGANSAAHLPTAVVIVAGGILIYVFRDRIRKEMGVEEAQILAAMFPRSTPLMEDTFQVCIWRVDVSGSSVLKRFEELDGQSTSGSSDASLSSEGKLSARNLRCSHDLETNSCAPKQCGTAASIFQYIPLGMRPVDGHGDMIQTRDGQPPSLCVRFYYGMDEIQSTRVKRLTYADWGADKAVYFLEVFTLSVEPRPRTLFRVEVRDQSFVGAALGHVNFDERHLRKQFERSTTMIANLRDRSADGPMAVEQVMQMMTHRCEIPNDDEQIRKLRDAGFAPHRLSDGGAVWLAFCDTEDRDGSGYACVPGVCL